MAAEFCTFQHIVQDGSNDGDYDIYVYDGEWLGYDYNVHLYQDIRRK